MASGTYNKGRTKILDGGLNLTSGVIRSMLVNAAYTFDPDHDFVGDISANEITVTGYARQTLANKVISQDNANDRAKFTSDALVFTELDSGQTVGGIVFYLQVGGDDTTPATDELIYFGDITDTPTNGGDITISPHADGWFYAT